MSNLNLNLSFWNCRSITKRKQYLPYILEQYQIDAICLAETFLNDNHEFSFPGYNFVSCERDEHGGGVATLIKNNLKYTVLNNELKNLVRLCNKNRVEILIIKIYSNESLDKFINIITIYSPPRPSTPHTAPDFWKKFFDLIKNLQNLIICGDFNAKNSLWNNSNNRNIEGDKLSDALFESDFVCSNDGNPTYSK